MVFALADWTYASHALPLCYSSRYKIIWVSIQYDACLKLCIHTGNAGSLWICTLQIEYVDPKEV
jgi:hypothetical protein